MIEIIEQKSISKTGIETDNEDGVFVSDNYVAVVDGATSKVLIYMRGAQEVKLFVI